MSVPTTSSATDSSPDDVPLEQSADGNADGSNDANAKVTSDVKTSRFFYGWVMLVLGMLLMVASSPGQTFGFSFFNGTFRQVFDLTQTKLASVYLVATVIASLALPYIGGLVDRFGLKRSVLVTIASMAGVCVLMSQTQGVVSLFVAFVFFRILGPGTLSLLSGNTLARWFDRRLGMASAIKQVSMAGAMAFVPIGIVWLIDTCGWRGAYLAMAAILAGGLLPFFAIVYRESPDELGQYLDGERPTADRPMKTLFQAGMTVKEAKQHRAFWILLAAAAIWALVGTGFVFHLVAFFQAHGIEAKAAEVAAKRAISYMAIGMGATQLIAGLMADRLAMRWLVVAGVGMIAVSSVMLATGIYQLLVPGYIVYGVANGFMSIISSTAWARYFGRAHLGKVRGVSLTAAIAGSSLGPLMLGVSDDYLGGFEPGLWVFAVMATVIAVACLWATPPRMDEA